MVSKMGRDVGLLGRKQGYQLKLNLQYQGVLEAASVTPPRWVLRK